MRSAFSGVGARINGGRWNSVGTPMVYTAGSLSLAVLEWRVHLAQWPPPVLMVFEVEFDESLVWIPGRMPANWNVFPAPESTATFGDGWIAAQRSVVVRVPSAVIASEFNYLLNPMHQDFARMVVGKPKMFQPDTRLGPVQ